MKIKNIFYNVAGWPEHHNHHEHTEAIKSHAEHKKEVVDKIPSKPEEAEHSKKTPSHKSKEIANISQKISYKAWQHSSSEIAKKAEEADKTYQATKDALRKNGVPPIDKVVTDSEKAEQLKWTLNRLEKRKQEKMERMSLPEWVEKELQKRTREEILKDMLKVKPETMDKVMEAVINENPELKGLPKEKLEALAREKIVEARIKKLEQKVKDGKGHEIDKTQYDAIIKKNPDMKVFDDADPKLTKELISVYGTKLMAAYGKLLKDVPKEEFPKTLEEFDAFLENEWVKEQIAVLQNSKKWEISPDKPWYYRNSNGSVMKDKLNMNWWINEGSYNGRTYGDSMDVSSNADVSKIEAWYKTLQQVPNPVSKEDLISWWVSEKNAEALEWRIPEEWKSVAIEFAKKEPNIDKNKPIALASVSKHTWMISYPDWKFEQFPIITAKPGKTNMIWIVSHFDWWKIAWRWHDASKWWSKTVLWAAAYSPEWGAHWWKWWHGVADYRIPNWHTWWCVWVKQEVAMRLVKSIKDHWGWYWYEVA